MFHVKLSRLEVAGVRNLNSVLLDKLTKVNIFYGPNGAGKTSILEAIHILGLARSFRSTQLQPVIQYEKDRCTVFGHITKDDGLLVSVGIERSRRGRFKIRVDGNDEKNLVTLAEIVPVQLINSTAYSLLEGGPKQRRQYVDWGVFHVEPSFYNNWRRMQRAIKQRNSVLRRGSMKSEDLKSWDAELLGAADLIDLARKNYLDGLIPRFFEVLSQLIDLPDVVLSYDRGWDDNTSLAEVLANNRERDYRRGVTHQGPHRADLKVSVNGISAGLVLSRGQQKLVVCAMRLAQCELLVEATQKSCLLLVDDLPAEIDEEHQGRLCDLLDSLDIQLFLTCVNPQGLMTKRWSETSDQVSLFHVKQGQIDGAK